jgi:hypothetical protein
MSTVICQVWGQRILQRLSSFVVRRRVFVVVVAVGLGLGVVWLKQGSRVHLVAFALREIKASAMAAGQEKGLQFGSHGLRTSETAQCLLSVVWVGQVVKQSLLSAAWVGQAVQQSAKAQELYIIAKLS